MSRRAAVAGLAAAGATFGAPTLLRAAAPRIVTVGGGVTETVFALGRGRDVAATDAASLYPNAAAALPKFSYPKGLVARDVLARRPDIVLVADEAGPKAALDEIAAAGVQYLRLPEAKRIEDVAAGVRLIADVIGEGARGAAIADALAQDLARVTDALRGVVAPRRALVLLGAPDADMLVTAGRGSDAGIALGFAGAENAARSISGWSWLTPAAAEKLDPEAVVLLSNGQPPSPERAFSAPGLAATVAGRQRRVVMADATAFAGFGPRSAHAIRAVAAGLYPEASFAPLPPRSWAHVETAAL